MEGVRLWLCCFPSAGSGPAPFVRLASYLPESIGLVGVCLPGRGHRLAEPPLATVPAMAEEAAAALEALLDRPLAFFGHSLGALVAFEAAHALRRRREAEPVAFCTAAAPPPQLAGRGEPIAHLPDDAFLAAVQTRYGGLDEALAGDAEWLAVLLPALRADMLALESYRRGLEPPLRCGILALAGDADTSASAAAAVGWREHTWAPFTLQLVPGGHFFVHKRTAAVARVITRWLVREAGDVPGLASESAQPPPR